MRTILKVCLLALLVVPVAYGQGPTIAGVGPVIEAGAGYSYVEATVPSQSKVAMNGVQAVASVDVHRRFGVKLEVGYARKFDVFGTGHSADMLTYMAGPVFYPVRKRNMNVYTHILLGAARETGVNFESDGQIVLGYVNQFAWAGGVGFQYRVTPSLSLRVGADYLRTAFFNSNITIQGQTNLRPSMTLIYTFGEGRE
jgi:opacity protein-like surface antigen